MSRTRYETGQRSSIILDAGYVSIKSNDRYHSSKAAGLHGTKLYCVILISLILFLISCVNLTCMIWIMYKLDWSPFHKNGSKVFRLSKSPQQVEFFNQVQFKKPIYTTKIQHTSSMEFHTAKEQIDIYGDHNSIFFDEDQISFNTDHFNLNNQNSVDFTNLHQYIFANNQTTKVHLKQIYTPSIRNRDIRIFAENNISTVDIDRIILSSKNLRIEGEKTNSQSIIRFNNNQRTKHFRDNRMKVSFGNLDVRSHSIFVDLPRTHFVENSQPHKPGIYRICICNTTFLLLRSFAHQPCPLC